MLTFSVVYLKRFLSQSILQPRHFLLDESILSFDLQIMGYTRHPFKLSAPLDRIALYQVTAKEKRSSQEVQVCGLPVAVS